MSRYYRRGYSRGRSNVGLERALQHIHEGEELSRELGGTDKDVKQYFFSLSGVKKELILDTYEAKYGKSARQYAEKTIPKWRSGQTKMSGMVASRLFNQLPPSMPLNKKYELVQNLWTKYSPRSNKTFRFGPDINKQELFNKAQAYLLDTIVNYTIPEPLENRFKWLSLNDVGAQQQLLNHFLDIEKTLVIKSLTAKLPVILDHIKNNGEFTQKISQKFKIGNHKLEFLLDPKANEIFIENPSDYRFSGSSASSGTKRNYFVWGVIIAAIIWIIISYLK